MSVANSFASASTGSAGGRAAQTRTGRRSQAQGGGGELRKLPSIGVTRLLGRVCCQAHPGDESEHAEAGGRPFRTPHSELRTRKPHRVRHDLPSEPEAKQQEDGEADRYPIEAKLWLGCAGRRGWNWLSAQQWRQELRGPSL